MRCGRCGRYVALLAPSYELTLRRIQRARPSCTDWPDDGAWEETSTHQAPADTCRESHGHQHADVRAADGADERIKVPGESGLDEFPAPPWTPVRDAGSRADEGETREPTLSSIYAETCGGAVRRPVEFVRAAFAHLEKKARLAGGYAPRSRGAHSDGDVTSACRTGIRVDEMESLGAVGR